jgi:hypothetical protein
MHFFGRILWGKGLTSACHVLYDRFNRKRPNIVPILSYMKVSGGV